MQFYMASGYSDPVDLMSIAKAAEVAGFDGISIADHLFFPVNRKTPYPYTSDGNLPFDLETSWPDTWVLIAARARLQRSCDSSLISTFFRCATR